jgi:hypothetical protein
MTWLTPKESASDQMKRRTMNTLDTPIQTPSAEYIGVADTAKLIRAALKKAFPGQKFSVRAKSYSMGCSIQVGYNADVATNDVQRVVSVFSSTGFDGMIDASYARYAWLAPDGTASLAYSQSRVGNDGNAVREFGEPHTANCRYVRFGADYVMVQKDFN